MGVRLRQAVVVASELEPVAEALERELGLRDPFNDPGVGVPVAQTPRRPEPSPRDHPEARIARIATGCPSRNPVDPAHVPYE